MLKESPIRWDGKAGGKVALLFLVLAPLSLSGCAMGSGIGAGPWLVIAFGFLLTGCGGSLQDTLRDTLKDQILPVFVKCKPSNEAMLGTLWTEFAKDPGGALSSYGRSVLEAFLLKHGVSTTVCVLDELRDRLQHQIESPGAPPEGSPEKDRQRQLLAKIDTALAEIGVEVVEDPVPGAAPCPETAPQSTEPGSGGG